ncbi:MAG: S41 family peptidase [Dehalococcoidia bacterium]
MKRVFIHIGIAILCTAIGVSIWLYINNLIFPAQPVPFEPEDQVLSGSDMLQPSEMMEDLHYLVDTIESVHPDPYAYIGEEEWERRKGALEAVFTDSLSAAQYYFALSSLVTSVGDAHTILRFEETDKGLALTFEWVEEGLVIAEDSGQFRKGDLILAMGDGSPRQLLDRMDGIVSSENSYRVKDESTRHLRRRPVLEHLGLVRNEAVPLTVERGGDILELTAQFAVELPGLKKRSHELLEQRHDWYVNRENDLGIFSLVVCVDDEVLRRDVGEFFAAVSDNEIETVVIDLRENIGGQSRVVESFLEYLPAESYLTYGSTIRYSEQAAERIGMRRTRGTSTYPPSTRRVQPVDDPFKGDVFILIGNRTFSAGNWIAVVFRDNDLATIIGEPTGNAPSSFGDMISFQLPNSRFVLGVSYKYFTRPDPSNDPQDTLYPDILINRTRDDLIHDIDPVIDYIIDRTRG